VLTTFVAPLPHGETPIPAELASARSDPEAFTSELPAPSEGIDWIAVGLGLLAFLAIGGLVPLWLWACLLYPSCPLR
jgi:hypothetical protein